jgi:hypothetical protein
MKKLKLPNLNVGLKDFLKSGCGTYEYYEGDYLLTFSILKEGVRITLKVCKKVK